MPTYRIEISPNNRAGCTDAVCKKSTAKCLKGSLRFGTWTTIMEHDSWKWKHWGCVSGEQIKHLRDLVESNGKFDYNAFDGYDEMGDHPDLQAKIRAAINNGHVAPEDFNGDPWMNKAGQRGIRGKKPKEWNDGEDGDVPNADNSDNAPPANGKKRLRKDADIDGEEGKKKPRKRAKKAAVAAAPADDSNKEKTKTQKRGRKTAVKKEELDEDEEKPVTRPKHGPNKKAAAKKVKNEERDVGESEQSLSSNDDEKASSRPSVPKGRKKAAPTAGERPRRANRARQQVCLHQFTVTR
ncbi:PARP-type zinc finger-containing protein [Colletotrichum trifolii]|uniref:PARP-type zinc finger-containing protein n=1 Tax=Colletotrichum trifolii TaxID=5466 RepID=A0A4R8QC25_COLTR|nr:PARP-type zinc finger-containing protein [Colletotrichum trifolii]